MNRPSDDAAVVGAAPLWTRVRAEIGRRADTFAGAAARTRTHADDEAIHDLRVSIRRLIAALDLWRGALAGKPRRRARNRLRELRRTIGPTRELEVHIADLAQRMRGQPLAIRLVGADLLDTLRRELEHGRKAAARRCREKRVSRILRSVWRACEDLEPTLGAGAEPSAVPQEPLLNAARTARAALTAALLEPAAPALHGARIALKRWRYAIEAAAPNGADPGMPKPGALRPLQETLGEIQDRATLVERITRFARDLQDRGLLVHAEALRPLILAVEAEQRSAAERFAPLAQELLEPERLEHELSLSERTDPDLLEWELLGDPRDDEDESSSGSSDQSGA